MKKVLVILIALILSAAITIVLPNYIKGNNFFDGTNLVSSVNQKIEGYSNESTLKYKIYDKGNLIGIVTDKNKILKAVKNYNIEANFEYDKGQIGLADNVYIEEELSNVVYEQCDDEIIDYLVKNNCLGIEATCVEFSNEDGVYDTIYVLNLEDYKTAQSQFILNFISQDSLNRIERGEAIAHPTTLSTVETGIQIKETVTTFKGIGRPNEIFSTVEQIYEYLCYGRNKERQYYQVKDGDTLAGIAAHKAPYQLSTKQLMMLNPDIVKDENQILTPGATLNVTYYDSPITIIVNKECLSREVIFAGYGKPKDDPDLLVGQTKIVEKAENGIEEVLRSQVWINGVLQEVEGIEDDPYINAISRKTIVAKKDGIMAQGIGTITPTGKAGTGNWRWPVANPEITCDYYCYVGHGGVDFFNLYNPWDYAHAIDSGVVIDTGWTDIGGYYVKVDHNNGYETYYGHFRSPATVEVGQNVEAGDILGPIGMTGLATGPHVHLMMYENGVQIDPCTVLSCSLAN